MKKKGEGPGDERACVAINQENEKREGNLQVRLVVDVVSEVWLLFFPTILSTYLATVLTTTKKEN